VLLVLGPVGEGGVLVEIDVDRLDTVGRSVFTLNVVGIEVLSPEGVLGTVGGGLRSEHETRKGSSYLLHNCCVSFLKLTNI